MNLNTIMYPNGKVGGIELTNQVCVILPPELRERARDFRINISETCRRALADEVLRKEKEARENVAKQNPEPATTTRDVNLQGDGVHG